MTPANPDKVSPKVVGGGLLGLLVAGLARALIDRYVDPVDREQWWNLFQTIVVPALPAIGAWLGGLRAKRDVTPITPDAIPRNLDGDALVPVVSRPTRAARPEERSRRFEPPLRG
ncbi:MAG TPA: hypothetical protein VK942_11375 [Actinomycetes bacterium]|nr:hypothetical protein [Actinomycetes bacterium]